MSPLVNFVPLQAGRPRPLSLGNVVVQVALFCLLLGSLNDNSSAQNVKGLLAVGNGTTQSSSEMLIDATAFSGTGDMCTAIAAACGKLGTTNYPLGATIDARGFTGPQVCAASNITTMLFKCVPQGSSTGATGGKLLLGNVNLYADGPSSPSNYQDGLGSGIGTPALIIPSNFWGIEGVSRGSGDQGSSDGTWLSVCIGQNAPVTGCTTAFPKRMFPITSTLVSVNTMTITLSGMVMSGMNIYPGELAMVKANVVASDNGTYRIQSITNGSSSGTITVTVPSGAQTCGSIENCGTLYLGTPILGFASRGNSYTDSSCLPGGSGQCSGFGEHIRNLGFNCQVYDGCIAWQNLFAQEESGADTFAITKYVFVGVDVHNNAQNFGPILNAEIYTGKNADGADYTNCAEGTTGIYIGDKPMRGLDGWTINVPSESTDSPPSQSVCLNGSTSITPIAAVLLDATNTEVRNGHCEGFVNCVLMGANNNPSGGLGASGEHVIGIDGPPSGNSATLNTVQISGNYPTNSGFVVQSIRMHGDTNAAILDNINNVKIANPFVGLYGWSTNSSITDIVTTDTSIRNRFDAGIRTSSVASGLSTNTDLTGELNFSSATTASYTFVGAYTSHPECAVVPQFNAGTASFWITYALSGGAFQFTVHFSSSVTGSVSYTCSARN